METELKEHKNYLNALNQKLKNTDIKFQRIIVPHFDVSGMNDEDIKTKIKDQDDYKKHFCEIFENPKNSEALIVDKNGSEGISIMMLDEKYLFLNIKKNYKNLKLKNILDGGFFFEDIGGKLTHQFRDFFEGKKDRIVID